MFVHEQDKSKDDSKEKEVRRRCQCHSLALSYLFRSANLPSDNMCVSQEKADESKDDEPPAWLKSNVKAKASDCYKSCDKARKNRYNDLRDDAVDDAKKDMRKCNDVSNYPCDCVRCLVNYMFFTFTLCLFPTTEML